METKTISEVKKFLFDHPFIEKVIIQNKKRTPSEARKILFNVPNQELKVRVGYIGQKVTIDL